MSATPRLFQGLFDDASAPAGGLPLPDALFVHDRHRTAPYRAAVGSLVIAAADIDQVAKMTRGAAPGSLEITLRVPDPASVAAALASADTVRGITLDALEVGMPTDVGADDVVAALRGALGGRAVTTYVEVPYDDRRDALLAELAGSPYLARLRAGGRAGEPVAEQELAGALVALATAGVAYKVCCVERGLADAGARPGQQCPGVLNLLVAADAALDGADEDEIVQILQAADSGLMDAVLLLEPGVRQALRAVGTIQIDELIGDLVHHGLLPVGHGAASRN